MKLLTVLALGLVACTRTSADVRADTPDLQSMINNIQIDNISLGSFQNMMTNFQSTVEIVKEFLQLSPVFKSVFDDAASKNIQIKVIEELIEGKPLSFADLTKLATEKSNPVWDDLKNALNENADYQKIQALRPHIYEPGTVEKITELITGKKFDLPSSKLPANDKYHVGQTNSPEFEQWKNFLFFWCDNYDPLFNIIGEVTSPPIDYVKMLSEITSLNYANLPKDIKNQSGVSTHYAADILKDVQTLYPAILKSRNGHAAQQAVSQWNHYIAMIILRMFRFLIQLLDFLG